MKNKIQRLIKVWAIASIILAYILLCGWVAVEMNMLANWQDSYFMSGLIAFIPITLVALMCIGSVLALINWLVIAPIVYIITGEYQGL